MGSANRGSQGAVGWTSMQLTYSTADVQRALFIGEIGMPDATPNAHNLQEQGIVEWALGAETATEPTEGVVEPEAAPAPLEKLTMIHGELRNIVPSEPPGARPLTEDAGILRLTGR